MPFNIEDLDSYPKDDKGRPLAKDANGMKVTILAVHETSNDLIFGIVMGYPCSYKSDGQVFSSYTYRIGKSEKVPNLIGPWTEPKPKFDPRLCPAGWWGYVKKKSGIWWCLEKKPNGPPEQWVWVSSGKRYCIDEYLPICPKWDGPWEESAIINPNWKGV